MCRQDANPFMPCPNGTAPVAGTTLFSSYYFWYSFSPVPALQGIS